MKSTRAFPDAALCATRHVYAQVYRCLTEDACRCPHGLAFAHSYYCKHDDSKDFCVVASWDTPAAVAVAVLRNTPVRGSDSADV